VLALPIWLARMNRRGALEAVAGLAGLSALLVGWVVLLGGPGSVATMAHALAFQLDRGSLSSPWTGLGLGAVRPVAQAALAALVVGATLAVRRDRDLQDDLPRLASLLAGIVLLAQFAANYWSWAYLPWALAPALLVLIPVRLGRAGSSRWARPAGTGSAARARR
jgi:uncharacterized membrane protein YhaH (DUF805 family)